MAPNEIGSSRQTTYRFVTLPAGSPPTPATDGFADARGASDEVIWSILCFGAGRKDVEGQRGVGRDEWA